MMKNSVDYEALDKGLFGIYKDIQNNKKFTLLVREVVIFKVYKSQIEGEEKEEFKQTLINIADKIRNFDPKLEQNLKIK